MMRFVVPITKIDEERREVWGYATVDEIDKQGEVVDFDGSKRAFEKWSDGFDKATGGESKGNLREMHRPIAAGKVMAWEADDQARGIIIGAKVIDEGAWVKTRERVYTGFSIGGNPTKMKREKRHGKTVNVIKEYDLVEVSLVDNPASPSSVFTVVKVTAEEADAKVAQAFNGLGEALKDAGVVKAVEEEEQEKEPQEVEATGEEDEEEDKPGAGVGEADPEKEREVARGAVTEQAKRISAMLARSARVRKRVQMEGQSISAGVRALESIAFAIESELFEALIGGPGRVVTDDEKRDVAVLTAAAEAVLDFLYSEFQQQLRSVSGEEAMTMTAGVKEAMEKIVEFVKQLATEEGRAAIVKAAKEDETAESMAAMHAMAHGLGAATLKLGAKCSQYGEKCAMMEAPAPPAAQGDQVADTGKAADPVAGDMGKPTGGEPDAGNTPGKKPTGGEPEGGGVGAKPTGGEPDGGMKPHSPGRKMDDVAEWQGFAKSLGEIGAQVGSVVQILTDLNSRVKTIESQPSTVGRPVAQDKTLGAGGVVAGASMAKSWEVLEQLAATETDTSIRDSLLRKAAQERIKAINFPGA